MPAGDASRAPDVDQLSELLTHDRWMRSLALRLAGGGLEADDIVQETWIRTLKQPPRKSGSPRPWLATVMVNVARNALRTTQRRLVREAKLWRTGVEHDPTEELAVLQELRQALARLPSAQRDIVQWRFFLGLSSAQIATRLEIPAATVRSRLKRALDALRVDLAHSSPGEKGRWCVVLLAWARGSPAVGPARPLSVGGASQAAGLVVGLGAVLLVVTTVVLVTLLNGPAAAPVMPPERATRAPSNVEPSELPAAAPGSSRLLAEVEATTRASDRSARASRASGARPVVLNVLDPEGRHLDGVELVNVVGSRGANAAHPGDVTADERLITAGASPLTIPRDRLRPRTRHGPQVLLFLRVPGMAWARRLVDGTSVDEISVTLVPEARMALRLTGDGEFPDANVQVHLRRPGDPFSMLSLTPTGTGEWSHDIDGLSPGRCEVTVAVAGSWRPVVLVAQQVDLVVGDRRQVELALNLPTSNTRTVSVAGTVEWPSWPGLGEPVIELRPLDQQFAAPGEAIVQVTGWEPMSLGGPGREGWHWQADLLPGRYLLRLLPLNQLQEISVSAVQNDIVVVHVAYVARLDIRVVHGSSGAVVSSVALGWSRGGSAWPREVRGGQVSIDDQTGTSFLHTLPGPLRIEADNFRVPGSEDLLCGTLNVEAVAGTQALRLDVLPACRLGIQMVHGDALVPFDQAVHGVHARRVDGVGRVVVAPLHRRSWMVVSDPGIYELTFDRMLGYRVPPPRLVQVERGGCTNVTVQLVSLHE